VLLCLSGGKSFFINDRIYEVNSGDLFIINQFEAHKIISDMDETFRRFVFQVHPTFLYSNSTENTDLSKCFYIRNDKASHKITLTDKEMKFITNSFLSLKEEEDFGDDLIKNITVIKILTYLNKYFRQNNKDFKYIPSNENKVIENSIAYIVENLSTDLTLEKIAKHSYISVNQLCRLFKKYLGTTVVKYITSKRITEAKKLLKKGNNVSDVALSCGFFDYSNFIRTFKNIVGISPGKYARGNE
jgi:AraC-like DNA-binding protein